MYTEIYTDKINHTFSSTFQKFFFLESKFQLMQFCTILCTLHKESMQAIQKQTLSIGLDALFQYMYENVLSLNAI